MSLCTGQTIQLDIHALISDGRGLARHDGQAVFVADALPGQRVEATVTTVKTRSAEAQLDTVLTPAPDARPAPCPHSGLCGGCTWQAMPYAEQLAWKSRFVRDALERIGRVSAPPVLPILPSPKEWGYRNKMEFAFSGHGSDLSLGLRRRASHGIVDVTDCLLQTSLTMRVVEVVRQAARRSNLAAWSRAAGGLWRFLVIREPAAGGCLVELIVAQHAAAARHGQAIADAVFADCPEVSGFVMSERAAPEDIAYGERLRLSLGQADLEEAFGGLRLKLGAGAFFQVNTPAAALLYDEAVRLAALAPVRSIWDLYCGVGSLGQYLARGLSRHTGSMPDVLGVEQMRQAVELARMNAVALGVRGVYHQGDVAKLLRKEHKVWGVPDLVVVDPPRAGLESGVTETLCRLRPERIVYVSCDPATLARDAARLTPYRLEAVRPVDLFPQTPHVESVSLFVRDD